MFDIYVRLRMTVIFVQRLSRIQKSCLRTFTDRMTRAGRGGPERGRGRGRGRRRAREMITGLEYPKQTRMTRPRFDIAAIIREEKAREAEKAQRIRVFKERLVSHCASRMCVS